VPELPEIEAIARVLAPLVESQRIARCRVIHAVAARPFGGASPQAARKALEQNAAGAMVHRVERRGKYLLVRLDRGWLVFHFRLGGTLIWFEGREASGHLDVTFSFAHGTLGFVDRRHLGRVQWALNLEALPGISTLGIEPLSPEFTPARLLTLLRQSRQPLKLWLMDQRHIAGLGNIYVNEVLWRARLAPRRRASKLGPQEARRLLRAVVAVLCAALECTLNPAPDLGNPGWEFAGLEKLLRVYGREGNACQRCGRAIRRIVQGGRGTYYCPRCQR